MPAGTGLGMAATMASPAPSSPPRATLAPASKTQRCRDAQGAQCCQGGRSHCLQALAGSGGLIFEALTSP